MLQHGWFVPSRAGHKDSIRGLISAFWCGMERQRKRFQTSVAIWIQFSVLHVCVFAYKGSTDMYFVCNGDRAAMCVLRESPTGVCKARIFLYVQPGEHVVAVQGASAIVLLSWIFLMSAKKAMAGVD